VAFAASRGLAGRRFQLKPCLAGVWQWRSFCRAAPYHPMNTCVAAAKHIRCTDDVVVQHGILEAGAQLIQKPFSPAQLAVNVGELLGGTQRVGTRPG